VANILSSVANISASIRETRAALVHSAATLRRNKSIPWRNFGSRFHESAVFEGRAPGQWLLEMLLMIQPLQQTTPLRCTMISEGAACDAGGWEFDQEIVTKLTVKTLSASLDDILTSR
jgi:hypothetical protein